MSEHTDLIITISLLVLALAVLIWASVRLDRKAEQEKKRDGCCENCANCASVSYSDNDGYCKFYKFYMDESMMADGVCQNWEERK